MVNAIHKIIKLLIILFIQITVRLHGTPWRIGLWSMKPKHSKYPQWEFDCPTDDQIEDLKLYVSYSPYEDVDKDYVEVFIECGCMLHGHWQVWRKGMKLTDCLMIAEVSWHWNENDIKR